MWWRIQDQFTLPQTWYEAVATVEAESDQGSVPFPSRCRLTAPLAQPPPCYQEAQLVSCVIFWLAGVFWYGRGKGRGHEYCDLTISCFVRSTYWSEDQLEAAINRRKKSAADKNRIKKRRGSKNSCRCYDLKYQCNILHEALLLRRKPFIFISWCFKLPHLKAI